METTVQSVWSKGKLLIKSGIIVIILLLLQIPTYYVKDLVQEREARQKEAAAEVSSKWAGKQNLIFPVLVVPFWQSTGDTAVASKREKHLAYFLPDELNVDAVVTPQERYRGIYKVMLYESQINLNGRFSTLHPERLGIASGDMLWNEASVRLRISDNKGLSDEVKLNLNDSTYALMPFETEGAGNNELSANVPLPAAGEANLHFSSSFSLNGSEQLLFTPVGQSTTVHLSSTWPHPSFTGNSLPQLTAVKDSGFSATWKMTGHRQQFPQQWKEADNLPGSGLDLSVLSSAAVGANLFIPVNSYQKIMRSIKYSLLCLVLTFAAFFLIETTNKKSAHPFQYGLVGLALILFYTLLLSFSEYIRFNVSYAIATLATIGLVGWFVKDILSSGKLAVLLSVSLLLLYGYIFTILQLQDYSLLLGSIGLFATLAVIMRFSRNIQW